MRKNSMRRFFAGFMLCALVLTAAGCSRNAAQEEEKISAAEEKAPAAAVPTGEAGSLLIQEIHEDVYGEYTVDYAYDESGRLIQKTERGDQVTDYSYHSNGNLKEEVLRIHDDRFCGNIRSSFSYRQDGTREQSVENSYGSDGKQTGQTVIVYDDHGNPITETWTVYNNVVNSDQTVGNETRITYDNTYDDQGRLTGCFRSGTDSAEMVETTWWYGENGETTCRQDHIFAGRLGHRETTVTNADGKMLSYQWESTDSHPAHRGEYLLYDARGNLLFREYTENDLGGGANMGTVSGSTTHYTNVYSEEGLLKQTLERSSSYYYDGVDMDTSTVPGHTAVVYTYDSQGRMISACHKDVHGNELYTETWEYDEEGNLIYHEDMSSGSVTYIYAP